MTPEEYAQLLDRLTQEQFNAIYDAGVMDGFGIVAALIKQMPEEATADHARELVMWMIAKGPPPRDG